jgi:DNA-directed RNA polymerase specialized sigma24 family protein
MIAADAHPARSSGGGGSALPIVIALGACALLALAASSRRPGWRLRGA